VTREELARGLAVLESVLVASDGNAGDENGSRHEKSC
jgi:hypothetical protein